MVHGFIREVRLSRETIEDPNCYPFNIPALRNLETLEFDPHVTFLVGENGSGKSTLIEAIAILLGFNAEGGSQNFNFSQRVSESPLHEHLRPVRSTRRPKRGFFLRAESLFNVATEAENRKLGIYGWESLHERSHGEAFMWLLKERFVESGLYILDEPEAALSPKRQLAMLARMNEIVRGGGQLIIATHSPILLAFPRARIYELNNLGITEVEYKDTEHYQITRDFLTNPDSYLKHLFS